MMNIFEKLFRKKADKYIALDVELDGMHPSHIIQLSYLVIEGRKVKGKNFYFSAKAINRYARQVHGISVYQLRKLSGGKGFIDYADEIYRDFIDCKLIIGHDVAGDIRYLRREFDHIGVKLPNYPPKLTELTDHFGLSQDFIAGKCHKWYGEGGDHPHDARYDAAAAYLCMLVGEEMA